MTKSETREVARLNAIMLMPADSRPVGIDYLARSFSTPNSSSDNPASSLKGLGVSIPRTM